MRRATGPPRAWPLSGRGRMAAAHRAAGGTTGGNGTTGSAWRPAVAPKRAIVTRPRAVIVMRAAWRTLPSARQQQQEIEEPSSSLPPRTSPPVP